MKTKPAVANGGGSVGSNTVISVDTNRVRPFADQPREYFDAGELLSLELSIRQRGQLQPAMVHRITGDRDHDYELVDGQRRWHACTKLSVPLRAVIIDPENEEDQFEISVAANFQRAGHTPMEIAKAIERMCTQGGRTEEYVATLFGKSSTWVHIQRRLVDLVPEIQVQLEPSVPKEQAVPPTVASELARLPRDQQLPVLQEIQARKLTALRAVDKIRRIFLDGAPAPRNPQRGSDKADKRIERYVRRTIQDADALFDKMAPEDFPAVVGILIKNRAYDSLKESVMTAIGRLETLHRRLVECRTAIASKSQPVPPVSHERPKPVSSKEPEFVYSHPMKCPKCLTIGTRFRRRTDADLKRDHWICQVKGCELKITNYNIKIDRAYQPVRAAGASA